MNNAFVMCNKAFKGMSVIYMVRVRSIALKLGNYETMLIHV